MLLRILSANTVNYSYLIFIRTMFTLITFNSAYGAIMVTLNKDEIENSCYDS